MFRKRKTIAPYFRLPNPTNPITGEAAYLYPPKKPYCRFTLLEALTPDDEVKNASITDADQWGPEAIYHCPDVIIHVHNQLTTVTDVYQFSGAIGDVGIALWDQNMEWRIISMLRPGLVGGCLAENHPGRGEAFDIHLGTWDATHASGGKWVYAASATVKAIDWRYGVPYPDEFSTGLFEVRPSDEYGVIYEVVALDCVPLSSCED